MNCIFCKIVSGEIEAAKIWEDENYLAILDLNPNVEGMALVLTKKHLDSYAFDMSDSDYGNFLLKTKLVAKLLEKGLEVKRVAMVMEGMGINHAHIKLYPLHGLDDKFKETWAKDRIYFENYDGYISTQLGPQKEIEELKVLAEKIKNKNV
jgi:histidine triad (HIT) family protein